MKSSNPTDTCCSIFTQVIDSAQAKEIAAIFKVLGEPARLHLISYIASQPNQEACVCELIEPLGLSQPTVSHHLKVLHKVGLLDKERRGNWIYYLLNLDKIAVLLNILDISSSRRGVNKATVQK
ncbi:MAG: metalloregulator ArsR/SmtB family transcription factor [Pleurocapsa sp. MO_226.B13]|nr:metalloregulator ArsR/SmtB family transcription factor [Pleurocapsa sp. MO_226.B13]